MNANASNVLLINSYHEGYGWTDELTEGIKNTLHNKNINLYVEYLDTKRFHDSSYPKQFLKFIDQKYNDIEFNLLITTDNDALDLVLNNHLHKIVGCSGSF
ncbi:MAG: hypothetical protein HC906_10285, partial [Bacteroidales bacterium]|nr:hypothetical protein [Bacteroidales bacterium]